MAHKTIQITDAKVGMLLVRPVSDQQGRVVVAQGSRLTPAIISRLQRWSVTSLYIDESADAKMAEGDAAPNPEPEAKKPEWLDEDYMRQMAVVINERFKNVSGEPVMELLKKLAFKRIVLEGPGKIPGI